MLQHIAFEVLGAALLVLACGMLWFARPVDDQLARFLRKRESIEIAYALIVLFALTGGLGSMLLGFTT
jgi:hypothetical protein